MRYSLIRTSVLFFLVAALAITGLTGTAVAHGDDDGFHHHDGWMGTHGNGGWFGMGWMLVWGLVMIGIPVFILYAIATRIGGGGDGTSDDALSVLRQRYARGEIDDEEFETRRQQLQQMEQSQ